jgi:glutamate-5-semialdehyde dehydrogenase
MSASATSVRSIAEAARDASRVLASTPAHIKNRVLDRLAASILARCAEIVQANAHDVDEARRNAGRDTPKIKRLMLTEAGVTQLAQGVRQVAALPDPVGRVTRDDRLATGLRVRKVRSPLGVIAMIYEARPGVTVDAFSLCFKSGNTCLLKAGREALRTSALLHNVINDVLASEAPHLKGCVQLLGPDREALAELLTLSDLVDLVIPRGGTDLIRWVAEHSRIPTIQHYQGVCHIYVDAAADLDMALSICVSAKTSAPATCNAAECVLVHRDVAGRFVPRLVRAYQDAGVEVRADERALACAGPTATVTPASPADFGREFLDLVVALKVVESMDDAIAHIAAYGSSHTEAIITRTPAVSDEFARRVQSSCVAINASTRFNDGFSLGLGAEIGISTSRLHAYGPMGLEELTTQRWVVEGDGHTR